MLRERKSVRMSDVPMHLGAQQTFWTAGWPKCFHYFDPSNIKNEGYEGYFILCPILEDKCEMED